MDKIKEELEKNQPDNYGMMRRPTITIAHPKTGYHFLKMEAQYNGYFNIND